MHYDSGLKQKVSGGVWRATALLLAVVVIGVGFDGERRLAELMRSGRFDATAMVGLGEVFASAVFLWYTVERALRQIVAVLSLGVLKITVVLVTGTSLGSTAQRVSRLASAAMLVYLTVAAFLLLRFLSHPIGLRQKTATITFLFATAAAFLYELEPRAMLAGLLVGFCALAAAQIPRFHPFKDGNMQGPFKHS